jgi:hypothetical protein
MRAAFAAVLLGFFAAGSALAQAPAASVGKAVIIKRTNGQVVRGRVIKELAQGFLFHVDGGATLVIDFKDVVDMRDQGDATVVPQTGRAAERNEYAPPVAAPPEAGECIPACRAGYTCANGECVSSAAAAPVEYQSPAASQCEPPCRRGYVCSAGDCVAQEALEPEVRRQAACDPACDEGQVCTPEQVCVDLGEARERVERGEPPSAKAVAERNRFQIFVGAIVGPGYGSVGGALALGGALVIPLGTWDIRVGATGLYVDGGNTVTWALLSHAGVTKWFGRVYGLGGGLGSNYMAFTPRWEYGWSGSSWASMVYLTPAVFRFGNKPRFELSAHAGLMGIFSGHPGPWGIIGFSMLL